MSLPSMLLGILLVALCAHVGVLLVVLGRALLPTRRHPVRTLGLTAGLCALVGELLALRALLGWYAPPGWTLGVLGLALLLGLLARGAWREHAAGRAAFHAVVAAPLVALFVLVLSFQ